MFRMSLFRTSLLRTRLFRMVCVLFSLIAAPIAAQDSALERLESGVDAAGWEAVGRLDIDGKGFCTAALIEPDVVLTAAHCLFDKDTGEQIDPGRIQFLLGLRNGRALAYRGVRRAVPHPDYQFDPAPQAGSSRYDLALLQLDRPVNVPGIVPFQLSQATRLGTQVGVVSYGADRDEVPSLQQNCDVLGHQDGVLIMSCDVEFGSSGAPVFRNENGIYRLVSVVSAMAEIDGAKVSIGTDLAAPMVTLREAYQSSAQVYANPPAGVRMIQAGEQTETGALFIRP